MNRVAAMRWVRSRPLRKVLVAAGVAAMFSGDGAGQVTQEAYIKASNTGIEDRFGIAVAISGNTMVVGAVGEGSAAAGVDGDQEDNSAVEAGAAYVFVRDGTTWSQQAYLKASNAQKRDRFANAVAISGDTIVVGARHEDSVATGVNGIQLSNNAGDSGAAYVFVREGTTWTQQAYLKASNTNSGDEFGWAVAISGDTIVVGAHAEASGATAINGHQADNSSPETGAAYVFVREGATWSQQAYLKAANAEAKDRFGRSVAVSGDTVVVGATLEDGGIADADGNQDARNAGAAYVFVREGTSWSQQGYLKASHAGLEDNFGISTAVDGDTVVVGAYREDSSASGVDGDPLDNSSDRAGAAYVFQRSGATWTQQAYLKAFASDAGDRFGRSVAVWGDTVVVGAHLESSKATGVDGDPTNNGLGGSGAAYLYARDGSGWVEATYLKASNTGLLDRFGFSVAMSGETVVVGAVQEDSKSKGVNGGQNNNGAEDAGAAYAFHVPPPECFLVIGDQLGAAPFFGASHVFETQVGPWVEDSFAVLMEEIPEFVLPGTEPVAVASGQSTGGAGPVGGIAGPTDVPAWMWDGHFTVQILLWNPAVFPALPEQTSHGLKVHVAPDGSVSSRPYGEGTGIEVWAETAVNADGNAVVRFPFLVPGL